MTFTEIEQLDLKQIINEVHSALYEVPVTFTINASHTPSQEKTDDENYYDSIVLDGGVVKKEFVEYIVAMNTHKAFLENERVDLIQDELTTTGFAFEAMLELGLYDPTRQVLVPSILRQIISNKDDTTIESIRTSASLKKLNKDAEDARMNRKARGQKVRELSQSILDVVAGHNLETLKTSEDIATMKATFGTIQELLMANQPFTAKPLIQALTPDALVTAELLSEVLAEYDKAGTI